MKKKPSRQRQTVDLRLLQDPLRVGDFRTALHNLESLAEDGLFTALSKMPLSDVTRGIFSAYAAELFFYRGENGRVADLKTRCARRPRPNADPMSAQTSQNRAGRNVRQFFFRKARCGGCTNNKQ